MAPSPPPSAPLRFLLAAVLLVLSLCASAAHGQVNTALQVHTVDQFVVVAAGVTSPAWGVDGPFAAPSTLFPRYLVSLTEGADPQDFRLEYTSTDLTVLTTSGSAESGTATAGAQYESVVRTQCVAEGVAQVMVTMYLTAPVGDTLTWSFRRTCAQPLIQMGTEPWIADMVDTNADGVPVVSPAYNPQSGDSLWVITGDALNVYMFVENDVTVPDFVAPFRVDVQAAGPEVIIGQPLYNASYTDQLSTQTYAMFDAAHPISVLTIPMTCALGAASETLVTIFIDYNWVNQVNVSFVRQCHSAMPLIELSVGTSANTTDIVSNGVVVNGWDTQTGHVYAVGEIFQSRFVFHMCLGCAGAPAPTPLAVQPYNVSISNQASTVFAIVPTAAQGQTSGELLPRVNRPFAADLVCIRGGTGTVWFELQLGVGVQSISFAFTYTCVFPLLNVAYGNLNGVVAADSKVMAPWNTFDLKLDAAANPSQWFVYISPEQTPPEALRFQYYTFEFVFNPSLMLPPIITDPNAGSAVQMAPNYQPISVQWRCNPNLKHIEYVGVTMLMTFGWAAQNNMEASFLVPCAPAAHHGGGGHKWNAAGIFFFTVFIVSLAACIAGCVFNYVRVGKRGWSVVPLYDSAAKCVDKSRGQNREWTPQMDAESGHRNTNYSNFNGDSYQSNL